MEKKQMAGWLILILVVVVAGVAIAMTSLLTEEDDPQLAQAKGELKAFFPEGDQYELIQNAEGLMYAYRVSGGGQQLGYGAKATVQGYGGPIEVVMAADASGTLKGITVGGPEFKETEGLGAKAKEPAFTEQFAGKAPPLALGENIDGITGATVTSQAVVDAVNNAMAKLTGGGTGDDASTAQRTANASVMSYGGPVLVNLSVEDDGTIRAIEIGRERFQESAEYGAKVKEPAFYEQFIGQKPPLQLGKEIEAVSGATGSSQAVVDAVNAAWQFVSEEQAK